MFKPHASRSPRGYVISNRLADGLDRFPRAFMALQRYRLGGRPGANRAVTPAHHLAIEAFPRSGNSFARAAFIRANPASKGRIATHLHRSAQVVEAARLGVPILLLIRPPAGAVTSLLALMAEQDGGGLPDAAAQQACLAETLRRYIAFHERVVPIEAMTVARFEDVTRDFGQVIDRLNARFGTGFARFEHSEAAVAEIFGATKKHLSPAASRDAIKAALKEGYEAPALADLRARAEAIHDALYERAGQGG